MINLLPPKEKENLRLGRIKNLVIILCGTILVVIIFFVLILFFIKFSVLTELDSNKYVLERADKEYQSADISDIKNTIGNYNQAMIKASSFYQKELYISNILAVIFGISKPEGVRFFNISLDTQKYEDRVEVKVTGGSDTRDNLLLFKKSIEGQKSIKDISFSQESWLNPTNINFSLTFNFLKNGY